MITKSNDTNLIREVFSESGIRGNASQSAKQTESTNNFRLGRLEQRKLCHAKDPASQEGSTNFRRGRDLYEKSSETGIENESHVPIKFGDFGEVRTRSRGGKKFELT